MAKLALAKALKKKRLSKRQFAKRMSMDYRNIYRLFRPAYNPRWDMLNRIAKAIGCKVRDLYQE